MKLSKRIFILSLASAMTLSSCAATNSAPSADTSPAKPSAAAPAATAAEIAAPAEAAAETAAAADFAKEDSAGEMMMAGDSYEDGDYEMPLTTIAAMEHTEDAVFADDAAVSPADAEPEMTSVEVHNQIQAGQLTAGEWNDNENWGFFVNLVNSGKIDFPAYGIDPRFRTAVTVRDNSGAPVVNASVTLFEGSSPSWTAVTDKAGKVYLFGRGDILQVTSGGVSRLYTFAGEEAPAETEETAVTTAVSEPAETEATEHTTFHDRVEIFLRQGSAELLGNDMAEKLFGSAAVPAPVTVPEESPAMKQVEKEIIQDGSSFVSNEVELVFDGAGESYPDMQIMFIVDTTGSMGDELMFLQSEFTAIADTVGTDNAEFSVNFYRDHGDKYVTLTNPFSKDINTISRQINSQIATGGGDEPEAVSEILDECMHSQEWRNDTVKVAFLIFDAPPHDDDESLAVLEKAMKAASAQGIRVIPVVSSNTARETELFGRGLAIFTGGTYVFLTDDSGIGESHLEPVIGHYEVESLYDLIIRLIEEYRQ